MSANRGANKIGIRAVSAAGSVLKIQKPVSVLTLRHDESWLKVACAKRSPTAEAMVVVVSAR